MIPCYLKKRKTLWSNIFLAVNRILNTRIDGLNIIRTFIELAQFQVNDGLGSVPLCLNQRKHFPCFLFFFSLFYCSASFETLSDMPNSTNAKINCLPSLIRKDLSPVYADGVRNRVFSYYLEIGRHTALPEIWLEMGMISASVSIATHNVSDGVCPVCLPFTFPTLKKKIAYALDAFDQIEILTVFFFYEG